MAVQVEETDASRQKKKKKQGVKTIFFIYYILCAQKRVSRFPGVKGPGRRPINSKSMEIKEPL